MALKRISDYTAATTPLDGTELLELETAGGDARKVTAQDIADLAAGGSGDVVGPASAVDSNFALFDTTTGKLIKDGGTPAAVATSGDAADVAITDTGGYFTGTDVEAALQELGAASGGGTGDVVGPASAVDSNVALFDTTTGKLLKDGGTLGTAAFTAASAYATAAQGTTADSALQPNTPITGATKTKITYDADGLVTAGADATTADIADSSNKRYVTDAQLTVIGNTSGTNTGDQTNISGNAATVTTNANLTGHVTSTGNAAVLGSFTVAQLNTAISDADVATGGGTATGTNTGDQTSVSGNAGTATALATSRNIDGQAFNGTADITVIAPGTHAATGKTTPVDADELPLVDSAASNVLKKLTWANLKATLKTYFDTLYLALAGGTMSGAINCADNNLQRPLLIDYAVVRQAKGSISGAQSIDITAGNAASATATGAITWTFSNPSPTGNMCAVFLRLTNGGAGAQTWPTGTVWDAGAAPTLSASGTDELLFLTSDAGTSWRGFLCAKGQA